MEPVLKQLSELTEYRYTLVREALLHTLGEMLKPKEKGYVPQGKLRKRIKQALIKALEDAKHPTDKKIKWYKVRARGFADIRTAAINGLRELASQGDKDVIPLIKKVANEDSYFLDFSKKKNYEGPKIRYPVREEAQKVLEKLKKEGKIKE